MFAFAALTQNFFIAKNRIYEAILLAGVALMVLRPQIFMSYLHFGNTFVWYTIGLALFGFTYLIQLPRVRAMARKGT
jgi:hypothetical protein